MSKPRRSVTVVAVQVVMSLLLVAQFVSLAGVALEARAADPSAPALLFGLTALAGAAALLAVGSTTQFAMRLARSFRG